MKDTVCIDMLVRHTKRKIHRGDVISFYADIYEHESKCGLNIDDIVDVIICRGILPNKQFNGETENNRIVQCMFEPEKFAIIKGYSSVLKALRTYLYAGEFDEVSTPALFQQQSPSNAKSFSVETINGQTLYLKSIHEHLLKPYLLLGFNKVFEIGPVFRNIGYSHEYDCEFHNLDIWVKESNLDELVDLCLKMTTIASLAIGNDDLFSEVYTFEEYAIKHQIREVDDKKIKVHIRENGVGKVIVIKEPRRLSFMRNFYNIVEREKLEGGFILNGGQFLIQNRILRMRKLI